MNAILKLIKPNVVDATLPIFIDTENDIITIPEFNFTTTYHGDDIETHIAKEVETHLISGIPFNVNGGDEYSHLIPEVLHRDLVEVYKFNYIDKTYTKKIDKYNYVVTTTLRLPLLWNTV